MVYNQQMHDIEFEEENSYQIKNVVVKQSFMKSILSNVGVSDPATANYVLLGVAVALFGIALFMYAGLLGNEADVILTSSLQ